LEYCCQCSYQIEREKAQEYSNYQQVYQQKKQEKKEHDKQLLLLKSYLGCKKCGSKEIDAYNLYENSQLVCQPCLMKKEGGSSGSVSFLEQSK
jgi:formylmethanofuran dehydrogenase subunit E